MDLSEGSVCFRLLALLFTHMKSHVSEEGAFSYALQLT